jgi:MscS family membrane protein
MRPSGASHPSPLTSSSRTLYSDIFMKRLYLCVLLALAANTAVAQSHSADAGSGAPSSTTAQSTEAANNTAAAAVQGTAHAGPRAPDLLEHFVDSILEAFNVPSSGNTITHFVIAALFLVGALVLRRVVTSLVFGVLKRLAARTTTTLDDKLFPAMEAPAGAFVMVTGIFAALKVLKLSPANDQALAYGSTIAFSLVIFWGLFRAFGAILDHAQEMANRRQMSVAAFMPWIKKTLITVFIVFGVLMVVQSLGYDVKALLAGLGIGGLAFALAAQDTLANVFGSIVVAIDQPFKIGEAVKIGANEGVVEDIGLRSTKLRTPGRNLIIIPNKTVAAEAIVNNSRFIGRRVEQVFGLTYDTTAEQMDSIVNTIRRIVAAEAEVDASSILVFFRDFSASSLDIWVAYNVTNPDFAKQMALRQRINLAMMQAIESAKLAFAFPTKTVILDGEIARKLANRNEPPAG